MQATFTKALRYFVTVTCVSPLRTGGTDRDLQEVLRYWDGTPFLQGTSLAGALNAWKPNAALFGSSAQESSLIVSDLIFLTLETTVRPRLAIDGATGTAVHGAKYDVAALPVGTTGVFQLTWRGTQGQDTAAAAIEEYLSALHGGAITLGAEKSNGYGRVTLEVRKRSYNLMTADDRVAWLKGDEVSDTELIRLPDISDSEALLHITAKVDSLLVKSATGEGAGESSTHAKQMCEGNRIIVPGSSIKGVLRGHIHRILPYFPETVESVPDGFFGRMSGEQDNGVAGKARFSDGVISNAKRTVSSRIRIDRITGGVMDRGPFAEETVAGDLSFDIRAPKEYQAGLGLLLFALRDLGLGLCELGSGSNIGRGRLNDLEVQIYCDGATACMNCSGGKISITDPSGLIHSWKAALAEGGCQ